MNFGCGWGWERGVLGGAMMGQRHQSQHRMKGEQQQQKSQSPPELQTKRKTGKALTGWQQMREKRAVLAVSIKVMSKLSSSSIRNTIWNPTTGTSQSLTATQTMFAMSQARPVANNVNYTLCPPPPPQHTHTHNDTHTHTHTHTLTPAVTHTHTQWHLQSHTHTHIHTHTCTHTHTHTHTHTVTHMHTVTLTHTHAYTMFHQIKGRSLLVLSIRRILWFVNTTRLLSYC